MTTPSPPQGSIPLRVVPQQAPGSPAPPPGWRPGKVGSGSIRRGPLWIMRLVDHWIGLPLCFAIGVLVTLRCRFLPRTERSIRPDGTIVVMKFFGLGSIIESTPLLRGIRERYPRARLVFVTFQSNEGLLRRLGLCTDIRVIRTHSPLNFVLDTLRDIFWMRGQDVDIVVDLEFFSKFSTLMAVFSGARRRVGYHLNAFWRRSLLTDPVYFNYYGHITDVYAQAGMYLDVTVQDRTLNPIPVDDAARSRVEGSLIRHGWSPGQTLVGVNVNAGDMSLERRWPVAAFVQLIESLLTRHDGMRVVLTGSGDESAYVSSVAAGVREGVRERVIMTAGEWSMDEFLASFERMACYLTNDSGPMHIAAAQGAPLVSLWGPGRPDFYAPQVPRHEVVYEQFPCSPCLYMFTTFEGMWCNHEGWCMQAIAPARVLAAVERLLAAPRGPAHGVSDPA